MITVSSGNVWRIGAMEFDEWSGRLKTESANVALDRSSAAVLSALLKANGALIPKDQLLETGWPGRIVHENSLAKAIGRLRKALGAEGLNLKAVYGVGYCFAVAAECIYQPVSAPPVRPFSHTALPSIIAAAALVLAGVGLALGISGASATKKASGLDIGEAADAVGRVLWVDDHPDNNIDERHALEAQHIAVYTVVTTAEALTLLSMYSTYDAVISDMGRSGDSLAGLKLVREMRARDNKTPFFLYTILTSDAQQELLAEYGGQGAAETPEELYALVLPLFEQKDVTPERAQK